MRKRLNQAGPQMHFLTPIRKTRHHTLRHFIDAMRRHDPALVEHGKRTAIYTLLLGRALHLRQDNLSDLCHAALLHDLGKLSLPNEVIHHNGLSIIGEYLMSECTPQAGAEILRPWPELHGLTALILLHHERWDGSGHPFGMRGNLIPLGARILSLADTVDQLLSQNDGPITDQLSTLIRILGTFSGTRFDPTLVKLFIEVVVPWMQRRPLSNGQEFFDDDPILRNILKLTQSPSYDLPMASLAP
jgi:HD-GYP domain-containing protein (c-di-GMP phosphodiesterase class II)